MLYVSLARQVSGATVAQPLHFAHEAERWYGVWVEALSHFGSPLLRRMPSGIGAAAPLLLACYALVPPRSPGTPR